MAAKFFCENPSDSSDKFGEKLVGMMNSIMKAKKEIQKQIAQQKREEEARKREEERKNK